MVREKWSSRPAESALCTERSSGLYHSAKMDAVDYLCKPFDGERLTVAIERALRRLHAPFGCG